MPCLFPAGLSQKLLWEDLFAKFLKETGQVKENNQQALDRFGLSPLTRKRATDYAAIQSGCHEDIKTILTQAGLKPRLDPRFQNYTAQGYVQYYELMLRDWAWCPLDQESSYRTYQPENQLAIEHILASLQDEHACRDASMLVLGSGAGRLSWDLHVALQTKQCVALDFNPLLSYVAHSMVKQQVKIELSEGRRFPRSGLPEMHKWTLSCDDDVAQERRDSWHAFAADAWSPPFAWHSFDLVVTPWFLDINGVDAKSLIEQVSGLLAEGGTWINYGPLLYPDELPLEQQYTFAELRQLFELAGFECRQESFRSIPYTHSPLSERGRTEDIWCVVLKKQLVVLENISEGANLFSMDAPPAWYILPHLPVPVLPAKWVPDNLQNIAVLFDGKRSINDVAETLQASLPEDHDPVGFVYQFLQEFCFQ